MQNLTGLAALAVRIRVLATSALSWLTAISAALVVLAQQLDGVAGVPEWATKAIASAVAVIATITLQVRRVTPVADAQKGLLPPKGPAVEVAGAPVDRGDINVGLLLRIVALVAFGVVALIGFEVITSTFAVGYLGLGLAAWVLAELIA